MAHAFRVELFCTKPDLRFAVVPVNRHGLAMDAKRTDGSRAVSYFPTIKAAVSDARFWGSGRVIITAGAKQAALDAGQSLDFDGANFDDD